MSQTYAHTTPSPNPWGRLGWILAGIALIALILGGISILRSQAGDEGQEGSSSSSGISDLEAKADEIERLIREGKFREAGEKLISLVREFNIYTMKHGWNPELTALRERLLNLGSQIPRNWRRLPAYP